MALSESTTKLINERLLALPEGIQHLISGQYLSDTIEELVTKYDLGKGAARQLSNEIMLVLLCFTKREEFPQKLKEVLSNYDSNIIANIHQAVEENIFSLVGSDIRDVWDFIETPIDEEPEETIPGQDPVTSQATEANDSIENTYSQDKPKQTDPTLVAKQRDELLQEIEEAEAKLASIQPIRTMQTDYQNAKQPAEENAETLTKDSAQSAQSPTEEAASQTPPKEETEAENDDEEPIHSTSQADLIRPKPDTQQYATLRPKQDQPPKWGSDNS